MSHFVVWAIVPKKEMLESECMEKDGYITELMKRYGENNEEYFETVIYETKAKAEQWFKKKKKEKPDKYSKMSYSKFVEFFYELKLNNKGDVVTQANPNAKFDYWAIGGRWKDEIEGDYAKVKDIFSEDSPFAIVDGDGWHERGEMGWWAIVNDSKEQADWDKEVKEILKKHIDDYAVVLDCHI